MKDDFCQKTKELWNGYFFGDGQETLESLEDLLMPDCVIIGTGKHEFYRDAEQFREAFRQELKERQDVQFQTKDFWCEQKKLSEDVCLTYGGLYIWWESDDKTVYINMESRFTILYKKTDDGWRITHIHQSMPNPEQHDKEYYPKTLAQQVRESQEKLEELRILAEKDSLTNLMNYRTFQECYANWSFNRTWLFVLDINKFKMINDTYGHLTGNEVLQILAETLMGMVRSSDIVCRMGGDEFIILSNGLNTEEKALELAQRIQEKVEKTLRDKVYWAGISVGMTEVFDGEALDTVIQRADERLYKKKNNGAKE